jgi:nuclear transport factor 2 (NTF2) superfamily protein
VTRDTLDSWLRAYGAAWEARDGQAAASLFAEEGVYCWGPRDAPLHGREAIRERWEQATGGQRDVAFRHEILGIDGDRGFARWWSEFTESSGATRFDLDGVFVLDFADDGLCTQLQEWWDGRETTSRS